MLAPDEAPERVADALLADGHAERLAEPVDLDRPPDAARTVRDRALGVAGDRARDGRAQTRSTAIATEPPPPRHSVAMP